MFKALSRIKSQLGKQAGSSGDGVINDDVVSPTNTYSSQKLEATRSQQLELQLAAGMASGRLFVNNLTVGASD